MKNKKKNKKIGIAVKPNHPLAEILAIKLLSIETVPVKEQSRMVRDAIRAAVKWVEPLESDNDQLKKELKENAAFVYNQAILATPTGALRNKLTEFNILRLQILKKSEIEK